eukprot:4929865-Amphidinium_carterae.1
MASFVRVFVLSNCASSRAWISESDIHVGGLQQVKHLFGLRQVAHNDAIVAHNDAIAPFTPRQQLEKAWQICACLRTLRSELGVSLIHP